MFATRQQMLSSTRETPPLFILDDVFLLIDFNEKINWTPLQLDGIYQTEQTSYSHQTPEDLRESLTAVC